MEFARDLSAALLTSSGYALATYPLHRVKVLLQTQDGHPDIKSGRIPRFQFVTSFSRLFHEQGLHSLWRGCTPYMLRHVPSTSLSFALKDWLQRVVPAPDKDTQPWQYGISRLLAGGTAGVVALAVVYPLDLANIRMAAHVTAAHNQGTLSALAGDKPVLSMKSVYKGFGVSAAAIGGYKALYLGVKDSLKHHLGVVAAAVLPASTVVPAPTPAAPICPPPAAALTQPLITTAMLAHCTTSLLVLCANPAHKAHRLYDICKAYVLPPRTSSAHHTHHTQLDTDLPQSASHPSGRQPETEQSSRQPNGTIAELVYAWVVASGVVYVATTVTYPLDVVRKRYVVDAGHTVQQYSSAWHCLKVIARQEGLRGLYRFYGYDMLLRLGAGVLLVAYDEARDHLHGLQAQHVNAVLLE